MQLHEMGDFLQSLRKSKGLTQQELADLLNVSNKTVSKWENGLGIPEMSTLLLLADLYDVSVDDILRGSKKMNKVDDKPLERMQYIVHKSKHQYINHLILAFGMLILGVLGVNAVQIWIASRTLMIILAFVFVVLSFLIQLLNLLRIHYQLIELPKEDQKQTVFRFVVFTSLALVGFGFWIGIGVLFYNAWWINPAMNASLFSTILPALAIALLYTGLVFLIVKLVFKFPPALKLSRRITILLGGLLITILTPFLLIQFIPPRNLAIRLDYNAVNMSTYDITEQESGYYTLKLISLMQEARKQGQNPYEIYQIKLVPFWNNHTRMVYYHFTSPTDYELEVEADYFEDFLYPLGYSDFVFTDTQASAYWFDISDTHLAFEIYGYVFMNLFQIWMVVGVVVIIIPLFKKKAV